MTNKAMLYLLTIWFIDSLVMWQSRPRKRCIFRTRIEPEEYGGLS